MEESREIVDRGLLSDLLFYLPSKIIPAILSFLMIAILSHMLLPGDYGRYVALFAIAKLSDVFAFGWLRQSVLRYYSLFDRQGQESLFIRNVSSYFVSVLILQILVTYIVMRFLHYYSLDIVLVLVVVISMTPFNYMVTINQAKRNSKDYAASTLIQSISQVSLVVLFVALLGSGYKSVLIGVSVGYLVGSAFLLFRLLRQISSMRYSSVNSEAEYKVLLLKRLLRYGVPVSLWLLSFQMLFLANRIIIDKLRSPADVGVYASTYDLINGSISLLMTPFLLAAHPIIMQVWSNTEDRAKIEEIIRSVTRYLIILFAPVLLISTALGSKIFFFLGAGYGVEDWIVPVVAITAFIAQYSMYAHKGLEIAQRTYVMLLVGVVVVCVNIFMNAVFVPLYSYRASAVISLVSYLLYISVIYWFSRKYVRIQVPWYSIVRVSIALSLMGVTAFLIPYLITSIKTSVRQYVAVEVVIPTGVYILVLVVVGEIKREIKYFAVFFRTTLLKYVGNTATS